MLRRVSRATIVCLALVGLAALLVGAFQRSPSVEGTIKVDGMERTYRLYIPPDAKKPTPLVLAFHGGGGNGRQMERYSRFNDTAKEHGFAVAYPSAKGGNWNDGRDVEFLQAQKEKIDDVKFVKALVAELVDQHDIDPGRVYATGISNGAFISHRLAAEASTVIAGIAPVVGGLAENLAPSFKPEQPVSVMIIQGDADPLVPIAGGDVGFAGARRKRGKVYPTEKTLQLYVQRNRNQGKPTRTTLDDDAKDGTTVEITKYSNGTGGVKTEYWLIKDGGHCWPGRPAYLPERLIGKACQEFNASEAIWKFFESCPPRK